MNVCGSLSAQKVIAMHKRVGAVEVRMDNWLTPWTDITYHCNESVEQNLTLRSYSDLLDALYALNRVKDEIDEGRRQSRESR